MIKDEFTEYNGPSSPGVWMATFSIESAIRQSGCGHRRSPISIRADDDHNKRIKHSARTFWDIAHNTECMDETANFVVTKLILINLLGSFELWIYLLYRNSDGKYFKSKIALKHSGKKISLDGMALWLRALLRATGRMLRFYQINCDDWTDFQVSNLIGFIL